MNSPGFNGQVFNLAQPPVNRRKPSYGGHAPPDPTSALQSPATPAHLSGQESDAIQEGKQRARMTMAQSGFQVGQAQRHASPAPRTGESQANGIPMTRKRSRSGSRIPARDASTGGGSVPIGQHNQARLDRYVQRDSLGIAAVNDQTERIRGLLEVKQQEKDFYLNEGARIRRDHPGAVFGYGYNGYGNGRTDQRTQLQYPGNRKRLGNRRTRELKVPRKTMNDQAECQEELAPVRLDINLDKLRLRDTFTWNINDRVVPPQQFAEGLVEDLGLPMAQSQQLARQVHHEMLDQITNHFPQVYPTGEPAEPLLAYWSHKNDDMRITVRLNITVGHITLNDQFEWDINNSQNSPEEFARQMAWDLSLSGEFTTAIAHSIREQSQLYVRSLYLTNYAFDGRPIEDPDIQDNLLASPMPSVFRALQAQKDWSPFLYELNEADLEKTELSILREQRAQKRQLNRRGGPALPDLRERPRTVRSLVVSTVIPGAAETLEASGIYEVRRTTGRGRKARLNDDGSESDDLDLEESGSESPEPSAVNVGTTARTRGMRGAATVAQAAMRSAYGRSQTPDVLSLDTPRPAGRRSGAHELREDTAEPSSLIVKLRIDRTKFKTWLARRKFGRSGAPPLSGFPTSQPIPPKTAATQAVPPSTLNRAPSTPRVKNQSLPDPAGAQTPTSQAHRSADSTPAPPPISVKTEYKYNDMGRIDAAHTPLRNESVVSAHIPAKSSS